MVVCPGQNCRLISTTLPRHAEERREALGVGRPNPDACARCHPLAGWRFTFAVYMTHVKNLSGYLPHGRRRRPCGREREFAGVQLL